MKRFPGIIALTAAAALLVSCGAANRIPEGQYRLRANKVKTADENITQKDVLPYIKQQAEALKIDFWRKKVIFNPDLIPASEKSIAEHLDYKGYYNSVVKGEAETRRNNAVVVYNILPGTRYRISQVQFKLPSEGTFAEDFLSDSLNVTVRPGDFLSEESLEKESERSAQAMRNMGYYDFSKNNYFFEADTLHGRDSVVLKYTVNEYTRNEPESSGNPLRKYRISDVSITRAASLPFRDDVLRDMNTVRPGDIYSEREIGRTYSRLAALKVFNSVSIEMSPVDTSLVRCDINLTESKIQGFKVNLEASTNSSGLIGVSPQLSYFHKNIFRGGEWLNLSFMGNFQFKFSDDAHSNEFGVSAGLSFPKFLGIPLKKFKGSAIPRTELKLTYNYQDRPEYFRNIFSTSYGYTGTIGQHLSYQLYPLQLNFVRLDSLDPEFAKSLDKNPFIKYAYQDHLDAGAGGTIFLSSTMEVNPKVSYRYARLNFDLSGNVISLFKKGMKTNADGAGLLFGAPFSQYVRGELTLGRTIRFGYNDKQALAARLLAGAGYAYGNSSALPFEKQFYCGGANSMRGWQARSLGPGISPVSDFFSIPSQTGDLKLEANLEYRFPMFWKLDGALFADVGNVWDIKSGETDADFSFRSFYKDLAADWGLGVRCDLDFIVIRVDMGLQVHNPSIEQNSGWITPKGWFEEGKMAVHFGVGYPF